MTPTTRKIKTVFALFLLFICLPTLSNAHNDEQANVRREADQFFAAFQRKDLSGAMPLWSGNSPDHTCSSQLLQQTFATYRTIELQDLRVNKISVDKDTASVQLTAELIVVNARADASAAPLQMIRTIQMVRETGGWKIWKYLTREDDLAAALTAAGTPAERDALLNAQPELVTP